MAIDFSKLPPSPRMEELEILKKCIEQFKKLYDMHIKFLLEKDKLKPLSERQTENELKIQAEVETQTMINSILIRNPFR